MDALPPYSLAVDGGGTQCRIALCSSDDPLIVRAGSVNVSTDFDGAVAEISRGLEVLSGQSGVSLDALHDCPAYLGLAGVTGAGLVDRLVSALPFRNVRIEDDRPAALRGALGGRDGVVAHCGTGSFLAAQIDGQTRFAGGWGSVLGDEASAQWVGRRALSCALDSVDGFVERSALTAAMLERFTDAAGIVRFAGSAEPAEMGALARDVTASAAEGDRVARQILQEGADYIARRCDAMGWSAGLGLCLTGGIGPHYEDYFPAAMRADLVSPEGDPLAGAIALAEAFRRSL